MHATPKRRRLAVGTMVAGAALTTIGLLSPAAQAGEPVEPEREYTTGYDTYLNEGQLGSTAASKDNGESCPEDASVDGLTAWHFVLQGSANDFETLDVTFDFGEGPVELAGLTPVLVDDLETFDWSTFDKATEFISHPTLKHAYVYTSGTGTAVLVDAAAQVTGADPADKFQLSHTCVGDGGTTDGTDGTDDGGDDGTTTDDGGDDGTTTDDDGGILPNEETKDPNEVKGNVVLPDQLPRTGDNDGSLTIVGVALLAIGAGVLLARRTVVTGS